MVVPNSTLRRTQVGIYNMMFLRFFTRHIVCTLVSLTVEEKQMNKAKIGIPTKQEGEMNPV